jgi:hypothetical protein
MSTHQPVYKRSRSVFLAGLGLVALVGLPAGLALHAAPVDAPSSEKAAESKGEPVAAATGADSGVKNGASVAFRAATCDIVKVTSKLAETERFTGRVSARQQQLREQFEPMDREVRELAEKVRALGPDAKGPEAERLIGELNQKGAALQRAAQAADQELAQLATSVSFEAYKQAVAATDLIAEKRGYSHVFATRAIDEAQAPTNLQQFSQGLLARPLVRFPQGDDITLDVLAELKLN